MTDDRFQLLRLLEAILFATAEPLSEKELAGRMPEDTDIPGLLQELKDLYANRGVHLMHFEKRWAFRTAPDLAPKFHIEREVGRKLSRAAIETLAIIAYHQPVTRAEIEEIRGVAISKGTLDMLLEIGWIKPKGRRETPGRPVTWATTDTFLEQFGLESCEALPGMEELKAAGLLDARASVATLGAQGTLPGGGAVGEEAEDEEGNISDMLAQPPEEAAEDAADDAYDSEVLSRHEAGAEEADSATDADGAADADAESDGDDDDDDDGDDDSGDDDDFDDDDDDDNDDDDDDGGEGEDAEAAAELEDETATKAARST
ncbi:MAG: SMC-Scp complex subunit ScpB [Rhodospirillaceae bacterium]|nr:SMC-Scp complex subunit ScpB [Rhodospirillaceae bacterium]